MKRETSLRRVHEKGLKERMGMEGRRMRTKKERIIPLPNSPLLAFSPGAAPSYITDLIKPYTPGRLLRSSNQFLLSTSKFNLKTYGGRSFTIAAPSVWNALPFELRSCNSLSSFKSKLKTWLFKIGYDVVV